MNRYALFIDGALFGLAERVERNGDSYTATVQGFRNGAPPEPLPRDLGRLRVCDMVTGTNVLADGKAEAYEPHGATRRLVWVGKTVL